MEQRKIVLTYQKQRHTRGCGLACVAMLTGLPYSSIRDDYDEIFGEPELAEHPFRKASSLEYGTTAQDLNVLLRANTIKSNKRLIPFKNWEDLPDFAILAVRYRWHVKRDIETWHWVVLDKAANVVYDPWISAKQKREGVSTNIRTDYKRMRPKFYMGVFPIKNT